MKTLPLWVAVLLYCTALTAGGMTGYTIGAELLRRRPVAERYFVDRAVVELAGEEVLYSVRWVDSNDQARVMQFKSEEDAERFIRVWLGGRY